MKIDAMPRHQVIRRLTAQHTEEVADSAIHLWAQMATQIISIVGEGGFDSLYARSVFLSQSTFRWLATSSGSPPGDNRFADLTASLQGQSPVLAREANCLLLITFTDILASLLGERLTTRILDSAWNIDTKGTADKEFTND